MKHHSSPKLVLVTLCALLTGAHMVNAEPPAPRELEITGKYLLVPVQSPSPGYRGNTVRVDVDGVTAYKFGVYLAPSAETVDAWGCIDMGEYVGRKAQIFCDGGPVDRWPGASALVKSSDEISSSVPIYTEKGRPQFHFSQRVGWNNDPNGMVYSDGLYHLSWQCNPMITPFANMFWGHAVSKDLVHWEERPIAIRTFGRGLPKEKLHPAMVFGQAYSGGSAVDHNNTLGKQIGTTKTIIAAITDTGGGDPKAGGTFGESLAYSTDNGKSYTLLRDYNPIISHNGRDPKLFWYEPGQHWCIVVYDGGHEVKEPKGWIGRMVFYSSKDLKTWTKESETEEIYHECPEFVELPVDGDPKNKKWLLMDATPRYQVGTFDGKTFKPENAATRLTMGGEIKAGQCFSSAPDGRAIFMVWARTFQKDKNTSFNQGFTLPLELSLKTTEDGIRCYANPVKELEVLRGEEILAVKDQKLNPGDNALKFKQPSELVEIVTTLDYSKGSKPASIEVQLGDDKFTYHLAAKELAAPRGKLVSYDQEDGKLDLRFYVDRPTVEVFAEQGAVYLLHNRGQMGMPLDQVVVRAMGGEVTIESLKAYQLKSIWNKP